MHPQTDLAANFNAVLDGIVSGALGGCPTDTGLDDETISILDLLARQPFPKTAADIAACRTEFGRQRDGTHEQEWEVEEEAEWAKLLGS